ncbi:AAA family ATPase [Clostridium saudiense]|uniref:AAA family ATPase n=1 Tax=Clostridium saudiense TaxID=1414720 RepID=UPI0018ABADE4|nr:AAA family ATPase [Clostridium saudiense]
MEFLESFEIINKVLKNNGINIKDIQEYDGIAVKMLSLSNTLDERESGNQTHIAITGAQMDIFPYLRASGYFDEEYENRDELLKKYFTLRIPIILLRDNYQYLKDSDKEDVEKIDFDDSELRVFSHVVRSRRKNGGDQLQLSFKDYDDVAFIRFRRLIHKDDYLIILKLKGKLEYEFYGIRNRDSIFDNADLSVLNNKFKKINNSTFIYPDNICSEDSRNLANDIIKAFKAWLREGELKDKTISNYISGINKICNEFKEDILELNHVEFEKFYNEIKENIEFQKINQQSNRTLSSALLKYREFINLENIYFSLNKAHNRIVFGAPGTGKSYKINKEIKENNLKKLSKRVTFHPNYTYSQFVGSYKPVSKVSVENNEKKEIVAYEFVAGPFLNVLIEALKDENKGIPHVLVIEEINRANPAGVFGDVFQLLDRNSDGKSTYTINMPTEMKKFVNKELGFDSNNYIDELYIPNNMYIWATMNSADQGVYPMDSAFKRRWSFEYIGIDKNEEKLKGKEYEFISLKDKDNTYSLYEWNTVRKAINKKLKVDGKVNEDKLLGPFFLSKTELLRCKENQEEFDEIFKSKVLMYLYEDILKHKKIDFFIEGVQTLSDVMNAYDNGKVFNFEIEKRQADGDNYNLKIAEEQSSYKTKE